jgi:FkbM family methyltransferase
MMTPNQMIRLAGLTRPSFRKRTPFLYPLLKRVVKLLCPPAKPGQGQQFVAPFEGGLIHIDTGSSIEYHLLFRGCHEPPIVDLIRRFVKPGDVCLDVGANVGSLTLVMAQAAGATGRVVAVEPHPDVCARLRANVALNGLAQVTVVQAAVSDADGTTDFFGFDEESFRQGISSLLPDSEACRRMTVRTLRGATLLAEAGIARCDFLKIDVEGVESVVLNQFSDLIERCRPVVICEYRKAHWTKFGHSLKAVLERFARLRYTVFVIHKRGLRPLGPEAPDSCELLAVPEAGKG